MSFNYFKLGNLAGCDDAYLLPQPLEVEAGGLSLVQGLHHSLGCRVKLHFNKQTTMLKSVMRKFRNTPVPPLPRTPIVSDLPAEKAGKIRLKSNFVFHANTFF